MKLYKDSYSEAVFEFCNFLLILKKDKKEIEKIKDKKLIKEMKAMRGMLFVMRTEYAYALLYEENENKANEIRKAFDMAAETYPYVSEVEGERYLMDKALSLMSK